MKLVIATGLGVILLAAEAPTVGLLVVLGLLDAAVIGAALGGRR